MVCRGFDIREYSKDVAAGPFRGPHYDELDCNRCLDLFHSEKYYEEFEP